MKHSKSTGLRLDSTLLLSAILTGLLATTTQAQIEEITVETRAGPHAMVFVPAGEFLMGHTRLSVTLDAFYIDRFEVSNAHYTSFVEATNHRASERADDPDFNGPSQPVVGVSWDDADSYCSWVGLRLPTEAEWERAAGGGDGRMYPWGDESSTPEDPLANWGKQMCGIGVTAPCSNFGDDSDGYLTTAPVDSYANGMSPLGVFNMLGNVFEWVFDWEAPLPSGPLMNPKGPDTGTDKVRKGGGWRNPPISTSTSEPILIISRHTWFRDRGASDLGIRCAVSADALPTAVGAIGWGAVKKEHRSAR